MDEETSAAPENEGGTPRKNTKRNVLLAAGGVILAVIFFFIGWAARWYSIDRQARALLWAVETAQKNYYKEVSRDDLYTTFFEGLSLDPYSEYYTKEAYEEVSRAQGGEGSDAGLSLTTETSGAIRVFRTRGNSPSERAGILAGMYILAFGSSEAELSTGNTEALTAFVSATKGDFVLRCGFDPAGTDAENYTVRRADYRIAACLYRDGEHALRYLNAEKSTYEAPIGPLEGLPEAACYLRIDEFFGTAEEEVAYFLNYMRSHGKRELILDLRSNGGGYLHIFQGIAQYFLRSAAEQMPIVATARYRDGHQEIYRARNRFSEYFSDGVKIRILADERTASASECLIGALVSYDAVSYGDIYLRKGTEARTYGKGIMQSSFTDPAGNVLKLTVAEIFWPDGTSIHGKGVTEADGAIAIEAPLLPGEEDIFLTQVLEMLA